MTDRVLELRKLALLRGHVAQARARRPPSLDVLHATVDVDRLWGELLDGIDALDRFAEAFTRLLGPPG